MTRDRLIATLGLILIALSVNLIAIAPLLLGPDYDPVRHSISESAAQQTPMAWAARLGLFLSGLGVLAAVIVRARSWGIAATIAMTLFGLFWSATAVFSTRSWITMQPFDELEDALHSVLATSMAVIVVGAIALQFVQPPLSTARRLGAGCLLLASSLMPLAAVLLPETAGVWQRIMFAVAYAWFGAELITTLRRPVQVGSGETG